MEKYSCKTCKYEKEPRYHKNCLWCQSREDEDAKAGWTSKKPKNCETCEVRNCNTCSN